MDNIRIFVPVLIGLCIIIPVVIMACSKQQFIPNQYSGIMVSFGSGGGFTGMEETTFVNQQGRVVTRLGAGSESTSIGKITRREFKNLQDFIIRENLYDYQYSQPGNAYVFLQLQNETTKCDRIVWELGDQQVSKSAIELMTMLVEYVKPLKKA